MLKLPNFTDAAILVKQCSELVVDKVEIPSKLEIGQVFVKVHVSGICGSQIGEIAGVKGNDPYLPHVMGHEGCAEVLKVGPGVKTVKKGDLVVLHWRKGTGMQSDPPNYKWRGKVVNAGWVTTFNSFAIISENRCTKIPNDTDHELAALFGCAVTTGFGVVENNAKIKIGESVVIFGSGGIGLNIIQASKMVSAYPIIAVDQIDKRLDLSKKCGATHTINSSKKNAEEEINKILGENELDIFIDNTGSSKIIELGYRVISKEGKLILVGVPKIGDNINLYSLPLHFGKTIVGSHGGESNPEKDIPRYLNLVNIGLLDLKSIISKRYPLVDINLAIDSMKNGDTAGRVLIKL